MPAEIIKVYKEHFPSLRLIGKKYANSDRQNGVFGHKWGEWFQNGWFDELEKLNPLPENEGAYLGVMRVVNGEVEYWIGMFFPTDTPVPANFEYEDITAFDTATCWVYGSEQNGEIFGLDVHNACVAEAKKHNFIRKDDDWCFERYNCPRYTTPDKKGNVILDYCIAIY